MLLDSQFRLLNSLCRVSHDSHCRPGPHFSPVSRWIDNEGEWPSRWQPPATPWPHMSDVWVPQHRRAVIWCMWTSTASQLIDWGDAGTACGRAVLRRFVEVCAPPRLRSARSATAMSPRSTGARRPVRRSRRLLDGMS